MSKGSNTRPLSVPKETFKDNWDRIFGKTVSDKLDEDTFIDEVCALPENDYQFVIEHMDDIWREES